MSIYAHDAHSIMQDSTSLIRIRLTQFALHTACVRCRWRMTAAMTSTHQTEANIAPKQHISHDKIELSRSLATPSS